MTAEPGRVGRSLGSAAGWVPAVRGERAARTCWALALIKLR